MLFDALNVSNNIVLISFNQRPTPVLPKIKVIINNGINFAKICRLLQRQSTLDVHQQLGMLMAAPLHPYLTEIHPCLVMQ